MSKKQLFSRPLLLSILTVALVSAQDVSAPKQLYGIFNKTYTSFESFNATNQFNEDFMTMYEGMKNDNWEYPEEVYNGAAQNLATILNIENLANTLKGASDRSALNQYAKKARQLSLETSQTRKATKNACCGTCIQITQADFDQRVNEIGTYLIDEAWIAQNNGLRSFCFAEDITFEPTGEAQFAFIIDADNINIDLCNHKLQQGNQDFITVIGFELIPDHVNISIKNGTICNFQAAAIDAFVPNGATQLPNNPFSTEAANSSILFVNQPGHELQTGDVVRIIGAVGSFDGIAARDINRSHVISFIDEDTYTIDVAPSEAIMGGVSGGGNSVQVVDKNTVQSTLDTLCFSDLIITDNGNGITQINNLGFGIVASGINLITGLSDFPEADLRSAIFNVSVSNCKINRNTTSGAFFDFTQGLNIENTEMNGTLAMGGFDFGCTGNFINSSRNVRMINCRCNNTSYTNIGLSSAAATTTVNSSDVFFKDCQFNDTFGLLCITVHGANLSNTRNILCINCQFNNPVGGDAGDDIGFGASTVNCTHQSDNRDQETQASSTKYVNCQFNGATRIGPNRSFINNPWVSGTVTITASNIIFERCQATRISSELPNYKTTGFTVVSSPRDPVPPFGDVNNITFKETAVSDVSGNGFVSGMQTAVRQANRTPKVPVSCNVVFDDCIIERLYTTAEDNLAAGIFHGVTLPNPGTFESRIKNLLVRGCRISDVRGGDPNRSAALLVEATEHPVICNNSLSDCMNGLILTGSEELGFTDCGLIQENKVDNCTFTGYRDDRCPTTSAFVSNTSFKNGTKHCDNYRINWPGKKPVCRGTLARYPKCERPLNLSLVAAKKKK